MPLAIVTGLPVNVWSASTILLEPIVINVYQVCFNRVQIWIHFILDFKLDLIYLQAIMEMLLRRLRVIVSNANVILLAHWKTALGYQNATVSMVSVLVNLTYRDVIVILAKKVILIYSPETVVNRVTVIPMAVLIKRVIWWPDSVIVE